MLITVMLLRISIKVKVAKLSARCKEYEKAIVDGCRNAEAIAKTLYWKYLESDEHKSKILSSAMHFYVSGYNFELMADLDEPSKPLSAL